MVKALQPFIVTSWHGHRNDADLPEPVREAWKGKFTARPDPRIPHGRYSNVDLVVLDADGKLVHVFDAFPPRRPPGESLGTYTLRHLRYALAWCGDLPGAEERKLELPDFDEGRGVRVFVSLKDDRMTAYQAPVVEAVPLGAAEWKQLDYPAEKRTIAAGALTKWLAQVYPPGVMERTNQRTKKVYEVKKIDGALTLEAAGASDGLRYATLRGDLVFTDEGDDGFTYRGTLEMVLTYPPGEDAVPSLRGVFDGIYPREDRRHGQLRELPLQAVFESRPQ